MRRFAATGGTGASPGPMEETALADAYPSGDEPLAIVGNETGTPRGPGPEVMAAGTLQGDAVVNADGEDLGKIKEIMIDVPSGQVAYAVLSSGGFLGLGDRLYAIPWTALALDVGRKCFVLDVDAERLKNAPGFDKDHWPSMADSTWAKEVHAYYGRRAYWQPADRL